MIGSRDPIRWPLLAGVALLVGAVALVGCRSSSSTPSPSSSPPPGSSPTGSPAPTSSTAASEGATPTSATSPTGASGAAGSFAWSIAPEGVFGSADVISDAAVAGTTLVAVGSREAEAGDDIGGAAAWFSTDGLVWQAANVDGADAASMEAVVAGPAGLVAVGFVSTDVDEQPQVWLSADGRSWAAIGAPNLTRGQMTAIAGGEGGYLAIGFDFNDGTSLAWTSSDGRDWSAAEPIPVVGIGDTINGVTVAAADGFICFGTAADGRAQMWLREAGTWQRIEGFDALADVNDVLATPNGLVAVGAGFDGDVARTAVWTSADGLAWTREPTGGLPGEMSALETIGGGYLAVGARPEADELIFGAAAWWSADGRAWQALPEDASFSFARMFELLAFGPGAVVLGERALDAAGEELAPAAWTAIPR